MFDLCRLVPAIMILPFIVLLPGLAQDSTGLPRYGSFDTHAIDTINLADLDLHVDIPIFEKKARGYEEEFDIVYDGGQFYFPGVGGIFAYLYPRGNGDAWEGISQHLPRPAGVSVLTYPSPCDPTEPYGPQSFAFGYVAYDSNGTPHEFNVSTYDNSACGGGVSSASGYAADGSGYYLQASGNDYTVTDLAGLTAGFGCDPLFRCMDRTGRLWPDLQGRGRKRPRSQPIVSGGLLLWCGR